MTDCVLGQVMFGATVSFTVTENAHEAELPALSTAAQVTAVVPRGSWLPLAGLHVRDAIPDASVAFGEGLYTAVA